LKGQGFDPARNKELMLSISTIPSIPVCRQAGILGLSNGVKPLMRQEVIWIRHSLPLYDNSSSHGKRGGKVVKGWGERRKECGSFEN